MSKTPPIPPDQRSFHREGKPDVVGEHQDRRDRTTGAQSAQPGDADVNLAEQGRQGNIRQNTRHQGYQQDR